MRRLRLPSPAMLVAVIALIAALAGTGYAAVTLAPNSVGTAQLKDGAVTKAKLSRRARRALKGARGATGATGATGPQGPQGPAGAPGADATKLFAAIDGDRPGIIRGVGATDVQSGGGTYRVLFDRDVTDCVPVATLSADPGTGAAGEISAALSSTSTRGIWVVTRDSTGTLAARDFNLAVLCP